MNDIVGYGVFATKPIKKGTILYVKDMLEIDVSPDAFAAMDVQYQKVVDWFSWIDARGHRIVSWDIGKYVNHSCQSNCISTGFGFEVAIKDIAVGQEITDEYGIFNLPYSLTCCCGSNNCRGTITCNDWEANYKRWNKLATGALKFFGQAEQPLLTFMDTQVYQDLMNYLNTKKGYPCILKHRMGEEAKSKPVSKLIS